MAEQDSRFTAPLYTVKYAAWILDMPRQTFRYWATPHGDRPPLVTADLHGRRYEATVPFIGFAEAFVVRAFRRHAGLPMGYLRQVLEELDSAIGVHHALASKRLYIHGGQILYDFSKGEGTTRELAEVLTRNNVFEKVVEDHLELMTYDDNEDGWAKQIEVAFNSAVPVIEVNPRRAFGQPVFRRGGARFRDVLDRLAAGEHPDEVADDFHVPREDLVEIISGLTKKAESAA